MDQLIPLVMNLIGGAAGGGVAGRASPSLDMGNTINAIAGAVGGGVLGHLLQSALPLLQNSSGTDVTALAGNLVAGGGTGAIVTAVLGLIINKLRPTG